MAIQTTTFKGARYLVKFHDPIEWDNSTSYEALESVQYNAFTYISKQPVPVGVDIENTDFWLLWADPNAQMEELSQTVSNYAGSVTTLSDTVDGISNDLADEVQARKKADSIISNFETGRTLDVNRKLQTKFIGLHSWKADSNLVGGASTHINSEYMFVTRRSSDDDQGEIILFNINTLEYSTAYSGYIGHANGLAYNKETEELYIAGVTGDSANPNFNKVLVFDATVPSSLSLKSQNVISDDVITNSNYITGVAYDEIKDTVYLCTGAAKNIFTWDPDTNTVENTGFGFDSTIFPAGYFSVRQSIFAYDDIIGLIMGYPNRIVLLDLENKKYIGSYVIDEICDNGASFIEVEGCSIDENGIIYLSSNVSYSVANVTALIVSTLSLNDAPKYLDVRSPVSYNLYVDSNVTKFEKGNQEFPFAHPIFIAQLTNDNYHRDVYIDGTFTEPLLLQYLRDVDIIFNNTSMPRLRVFHCDNVNMYGNFTVAPRNNSDLYVEQSVHKIPIDLVSNTVLGIGNLTVDVTNASDATEFAFAYRNQVIVIHSITSIGTNADKIHVSLSPIVAAPSTANITISGTVSTPLS